MKNLLYIGNKLFSHGLNKTTIETLGPLLEQEDYSIVYSSSQKNQVLRIFDMLWCVLKNRNVDYVLIDTYSTSSFWYVFFTSQLCRLLKLKYIPFLHGGNLPNRLQNNPKISQVIFKNAYINVAPSHYLISKFETFGINNIIFIPNVLEIENYPFKKRENLQPKLLWVRSFATIYNPKMAVDVLLKLKKRYPEASLCMVGPDKDGSLEVIQKYASELQIDVKFTGKLSRNEWITLSQDFDVFINTTHFDNTPVSVMEAMALGLAIVSTNVGGIPFLVTHNKEAQLVPDSNEDLMVEAIVKIIEDQVYSQMQINLARQKAETFDWENVKKLWNNLLK
ncbi:glycosyltransferase family 4 protein [Flavobacterium sp.]|uniref:glycosyltransferase family 4 protein n=1 Tax=Flavobacterium sp. TaxID=239 RepID=UPI002613D84D|nr:glycosyltransferase family 4 protein [Flavobacterium sp.]